MSYISSYYKFGRIDNLLIWGIYYLARFWFMLCQHYLGNLSLVIPHCHENIFSMTYLSLAASDFLELASRDRKTFTTSAKTKILN